MVHAVNVNDPEDEQEIRVEMVTLEDAEAAVKSERARIREDFRIAIEGQDFDDWRDLVAMREALNRICPEDR